MGQIQTCQPPPSSLLHLGHPRDLKPHAIEADDSHSLADLYGAVCLGAPVLAMDEYSSGRRKFAARLADFADQAFPTESWFGFLRAEHQIADRQHETPN